MMQAHRIGYCHVVYWLAFLAGQPGAAAVGVEKQSPGDTVKTVTRKMQSALRSQQEGYKNDPRRVGSYWRIYDAEIDGISLLYVYRNSISEELQRETLDALIARMEQKNDSLQFSASK